MSDELFPRCPQWLNETYRAKDYDDGACKEPRCMPPRCHGLGVYEDIRGSIRICETYRKWRSRQDGPGEA